MKKKIMIVGIFILVILVIVIISIFTVSRNTTNTNSTSLANYETNILNEVQENDINETIAIKIGDEEEESNWIEYDDVPSNVTNQTYFYVVQSCIKEYIYNIFELDEKDSEKTKEEIRISIYNTLSSSYIDKNGINYDNIEGYVRLNECDSFIGIKTMMQLNIEGNKIMRYVARCMMSTTDGEMTYINVIVYLDYSNLTFAIEPVENDITDLTSINLTSSINEINKNDDNSYTLKGTTTEDLLTNYLKIISKLCLKYPEVAYEYLNEDYKNENFTTLESFKEYIEKNKSKFEDMEINNYTVEQNEDVESNQYLITLNNGYQIRIVQTAIMQFNFEIL